MLDCFSHPGLNEAVQVPERIWTAGTGTVGDVITAAEDALIIKHL